MNCYMSKYYSVLCFHYISQSLGATPTFKLKHFGLLPVIQTLKHFIKQEIMHGIASVLPLDSVKRTNKFGLLTVLFTTQLCTYVLCFHVCKSKPIDKTDCTRTYVHVTYFRVIILGNFHELIKCMCYICTFLLSVMQYTSLPDFECNLHFVVYLLFDLSFYYHLSQHIPLTVDVGCLFSSKFMLK